MFSYLYTIGTKIVQLVKSRYDEKMFQWEKDRYNKEMASFVAFVNQGYNEGIVNEQELLSWDPLLQPTIQFHDQRYTQLLQEVLARNGFNKRSSGVSLDLDLTNKQLVAQNTKSEYIEKAQTVTEATMSALYTSIHLPIDLAELISIYVTGDHTDIEHMGENIFNFCLAFSTIED